MNYFLHTPHLVGGRRITLEGPARRCAFESLEPRQLLAADASLSGALSGADVSFGQTGGQTGSIAGSVFAASAHADCDSHVGAHGMNQVRVQLLDRTGAVVEESVTDDQGAYQFADLLPGQYAVRQLTPQGFAEGTSQVGDGGGVSLDMNLVSEIIVQPGQTLEGYDFCDHENVVEPAGPADRPIIPHEIDNTGVRLFVPLPSISFPTTPSSVPSVNNANSFVPTANSTAQVAEPIQQPSQSSGAFGGSSRVLKPSEGIKAWDEFPQDGLFSTASYFDLASSQLPTIDEIVSQDDESVVGDDAAFVDGYTTKSIDWCEDGDCFELDQLADDSSAESTFLGDFQVIRLDGQQADAGLEATPKIASLPDESTSR